MLQNQNRLRIYTPYHISHSFQQINTTLIVAPCIPRTSYILSESFSQIKSESINMIFIYPMCIHSINIILRPRTFMIEVTTYIEIMRRIYVKPWIVGCGFTPFACRSIPIQLSQRTLVESMIQSYIKDNSDTSRMTFIHESFEHLRASIIFIQCMMERDIISPAKVTLKLHHRHQLYSINP